MKSTIRTNKAPKPAAAYEQAIVSGDLIFVSGQVATNPATGTIDAAAMEDQVTQVLRNIETIVRAAGGSKQSIVRCGVFLSDLGDFAAMNGAYKEFFGDALPARTTVQAGLGILKVEIDAIAVRSSSRKRTGKSRTKKKVRKRS
jgi:2-iminobutanoate/2-iminopropanoate deaminase